MSDLTERAPLLCEAITEAFGERCDEFEPDCWCCRAWQELDGLTRELAEARDKALEEAAKVAERSGAAEDIQLGNENAIAFDIRALKEKP